MLVIKELEQFGINLLKITQGLFKATQAPFKKYMVAIYHASKMLLKFPKTTKIH